MTPRGAMRAAGTPWPRCTTHHLHAPEHQLEVQLRRIEKPNEREYRRLVLHLDDLETLAQIAVPDDKAELEMNDFVLETTQDVETILERSGCIKRIKLNRRSIYLTIYPSSANLTAHGNLNFEDSELFLRLDAILRNRETSFTLLTLFLFPIILSILMILTYPLVQLTDWLSGPISLTLFAVVLGLNANALRKTYCLRIKGRGTRLNNWLPNPSVIITSLISAGLIAALGIVLGAYFSTYVKPWLDRVLPASISTNMPAGRQK
jgi:hypothetical protein